MKKSFKKVVAILLAVMMIVCSVPLTVFAAGDANRANINLQFGDVSCTTTKKTVLKPRDAKMADYLTHSGLNSDKLTYSNGKIDGYVTGDFFTVSVLLENVTELSAAEVAIKYSEAIEPAYIIDYKGRGNNVTVAYMYNEVTTEGPHADFPINGAIPTQSGSALYNSTSTLGETSYVDPEARIMHANFAVQTGADSVSLTDSKAVLATFMFKIVNDQPITFSIDNTQSDPYETYTLGTIANGGKVEEYKTYAKVSETDVPALDFMGENEYNGTVGKNYTITFVDADGQQISSAEYKEGTAIVPPSLPATTHDDAQHYTYAWDKEIPATATANGTYTIIKTGAAHTWDAGVVTTEPTTTTTGVKTYTCTFDGCGATRTEELPKVEETHQHTWSEWKYNGDAKYVSKTNYKNGTSTRTCTDPNCPDHATETKTIPNTGLLRVRTINADFGGEIAASFSLAPEQYNAFDEVYAIITRADGVQIKVPAKKFYDYNSKIWIDYGFTPQGFNSSISIRFYATKDGETYWGDDYEYNMIDKYVRKQLDQTTNQYWKKLLVEMMYYGTEAQYYANWDTENPMINILTEEEKALHSTEPLNLTSHKNNSYVVIDNPKVIWRSLRLTFGAGTVLEFRTRAYTPNENTKVVVEVNGFTRTYQYSNEDDREYFVDDGAGGVWFQYRHLLTKYLRTPVHITFYEGDTQISNTYQWSAETYALGRTTDKPDYKMSMQLMRFGNAAIDYFANK